MFDIFFIPIINVLILGVTVIITFSLAYYNEHIFLFLPYISDTGTFPPESCIFGQSLNIISVLILYALFVRYSQVKLMLTIENTKILKLNQVTLYAGFCAALGISVVANFQETNAIIIHWIGAVMTFGSGSIYQILHTIMCTKLESLSPRKNLTILHGVLAVISITTFLVFFVTAMLSYLDFEGEEYTKWKMEDGGYNYHITSVIAEWICASSTMTYLLLFVYFFKNVRVHPITVSLKTENKVATDLREI